MKKEQKLRNAFRNIQQRYPKLKAASANSRRRHLIHLEASILDQIRRLRAMPVQSFPNYHTLLNQYIELLNEVSERILAQYNERNHTDYTLSSIVEGNDRAYLKSGILSVLVSSHIPQMVRSEFKRLLPDNPADEFPQARALTRTFYLHLGETNTGKTYEALQKLKVSKRGVYLAPLRILALENFERLNEEGIPCSLVTGEEEIYVEGAELLCCTIEKLSLHQSYDVAVVDEVQLLADSQRGDAWSNAILGLRCSEIHLCGALLAKEQVLSMIHDCKDEYVLKEYTRLVPLELESKLVRLDEVVRGDALVAFSKRSVLRLSGYFTRRGIANSIIYGDLPPEVRRLQYEAFVKGENPILIATDAIGMGINLPIRRLIFTEVEKFDGETFRPLSPQEIKQIAGRAGRIGIYPVGYVASLHDTMDFIADQLQAEDEPIEQAVIGPSEAILEISLLPLREKLALWSTEPEHLPYYRKKDIQGFILILDLVKEYKLPETVEWRLMHIPFDLGNQTLLFQFSEYAHECFSLHRQELSKPRATCQTCADWELYYQQISLYYSFSKAMNLPFDDLWVKERRKQVSKTIDKLLQQD